MKGRFFFDAAVIGGGPAGASFARVFARAGRSVLVIEKAAPGRGSVCGGFLGPEISDSITLAGLEQAFDTLPKNRIGFLKVSRPGAAPLTSALGLQRGFAVDRGLLNEALAEAAQAAGARFSFHSAVVQTRRSSQLWDLTIASPHGPQRISARHLIRTSGRRMPAVPARGTFFACYAVYETPADDSDTVQLHFVKQGHVGLNPLGGGKMTLCLHVHGRYLKEAAGDLDRMLAGLCVQNASLSGALRTAARISEWACCAAEPDNRRIHFEKGAFHAGDAVTMIHPVVGGGLPVAIGSGALLAAILAAPDASLKKCARRYRDAWEKRYGARAAVAAWLGRIERSDTAARAVFGLLETLPGFLPRLVSRSRA